MTHDGPDNLDPLREFNQARAVRTAFMLGWLCCGVAVAIVEWLR